MNGFAKQLTVGRNLLSLIAWSCKAVKHQWIMMPIDGVGNPTPSEGLGGLNV
jgi:hypothetical protein